MSSRQALDSLALWKDSATLTLSLENGRRLAGFLNDDVFVASGLLTAA
jgi:hypothetical protein